jgi:hypothetical protein
MNTIQNFKPTEENSPISNQPHLRPLNLNDTNYRHNLDSDYMEKIANNTKAFRQFKETVNA